MKRPFTIAAGVAATTSALPLVALAQADPSWSYGRHLQPDIHESRLTLVYGVLETDNMQFMADCQIGASRTYVQMMISAPIGDLVQDAPARVTFHGADFVQDMDGTVVRAEEFFHGIEVALETDDVFWTVMATQPLLTYSIGGHGSMRLHLNGAAESVRAFVQDCRNFGDLHDAGAAGDAADWGGGGKD